MTGSTNKREDVNTRKGTQTAADGIQTTTETVVTPQSEFKMLEEMEEPFEKVLFYL